MLIFGYIALAALLYAGRSVLVAVTLHLSADRALRTRALDIEERKVAIQENRGKNPTLPKAIPSDLYRRITKWDSPEAQDAERKILLDLYNEFQDAPDPWVEVRSHLPAEPSDELPQEMFTGMLQS